MKFSILILLIASSSAFAADQCASVWVYRAFKSCANPANGLDMTRPEGSATKIKLASGWLSGGKKQEQVCSDVAGSFNQKNLGEGLFATVANPTPVGEESADRILMQEYRYTCQLSVQKYPFKTTAAPVCGSEEKLSYQVGGSPDAIQGSQISCLSCDNLGDQPPTALVDCLKNSITTIVEPKAIDLRDSDLNAISKQVTHLLSINQSSPIANLKTTDQLRFFTDYLTQHPVQNEPGGGWGGLGNKPTQQ